ncbi:response regulator [Salinisphaera sp. T31B1]|uniref:response regulator n=1 Tax=Salinisphaera sp. T31B1 TaxID=727963 RepID=UPI00333F9EF2
MSHTVWVVEADQGVRESIEGLLNSAGYNVQSYRDATAFLREFRKAPRGSVLIGDHLARLDGLEVLNGVFDIASDAEVVFLTSHAADERATAALRIGACSVLEKPYDPMYLMGIIAANALAQVSAFSA